MCFQHHAEHLLLRNASAYLSALLSGRLRTPVKCRHLATHMCLCQYVELMLAEKVLTL